MSAKFIEAVVTCLVNSLLSVSQADDVNWWGHKFGFISGGFLGATSRKHKSLRKDPANVRQTFAEEDQEKLYNLVQVAIMHFTRVPEINSEHAISTFRIPKI